MNKVISAKRLPKDPGPPAWKSILPDQKRYPILEDNILADWLIIGGGFTGLSAAKRICEITGGDSVVLLEASEIASGPAGRNSGFMIDLPHELGSGSYQDTIERDKLHVKLNRYALDFAKKSSKEYEMPDEAADPVGRINGVVNDTGEKHNHEYSEHLKKLGENFKLLSSDEMKEVTGTDFYRSGLFMPGCLMLQPALYISKLGEGISNTYQKNFQIYENSPAIKFEKKDGGWLANTSKGSVFAKKVIMAVNGHIESFGFYKRRLMHVFTYASMTRKLTEAEQKKLGGKKSWGITPSDPMGSTLRRISGISGDRILIRNRWTFDPTMEISESRIEKFGKDQDDSFKKRFYMIPDVTMEYRWAGRLCLSLNSVPAFGEVEKDMYSACCQNGIGTAKGTLAGIGAAELASGIKSEIVNDMQSYEQPKKLPPEPLSTIGARSVIRWREFKAREEL